MKELWVKQTAFKRLLIEDDDIDTVKEILKQNTKDAFDLIVDVFDANREEEFDEIEPEIPFQFSISPIYKKATNPINE